MSKIDPEKLGKLDRRSTMLLQAARAHAGHVDEKDGLPIEDPGIDALRGSFGTVGSIIRARTLRMSQSSHNTTHVRMRPTGASAPYDPTHSALPRLQLYDPPVRRDDTSSIAESVASQPNKRPTIKFDSQDVVHSYKRPGTGDNTATHEHRQAQTSRDGYPPIMPGNDKEIASPTMLRSATEPLVPKIPPPQAGQLVNIPPLVANEHRVQSAPATIQTRFARQKPPVPARADMKDLFDSNSGKETLLSFPSVTDSAPSEWELADVEKESREHTKKDKSKERVKSPKRYPGGSADDDEEESRILFGRGVVSSEEDENRSTTPSPVVPGIRLVSTTPRDGYF